MLVSRLIGDGDPDLSVVFPSARIQCWCPARRWL